MLCSPPIQDRFFLARPLKQNHKLAMPRRGAKQNHQRTGGAISKTRTWICTGGPLSKPRIWQSLYLYMLCSPPIQDRFFLARPLKQSQKLATHRRGTKQNHQSTGGALSKTRTWQRAGSPRSKTRFWQSLDRYPTSRTSAFFWARH